MKRRLRRTGLLIALLLMAYAVKQLGESSADLLVDMGTVYECQRGELYNGAECVARGSIIAPAPPCYLGWEQKGNQCHWKG